MPRRWRGWTTRCDWLRDEGTAAVLCDAPPVPLVAARRAGVPGFLHANFTWADIYAPHARRVGGEAPRLVAELRAAYRQATALFRIRAGLADGLADAGRSRSAWSSTRAATAATSCAGTLGLTRREKLVYFYIGRYGQDDLDWERLERLGARRIHFVGFHPAPGGQPDEPARRPVARLDRRRPDRLEPTRSSPRPATARPARRWPAARR